MTWGALPLPVEFIGRARDLIRRLVQSDQATTKATLDALIPLYDQLKRRGTVRGETVAGALRTWRTIVPEQGRLSIRIEHRRRHARIDELRVLTSKYREGTWDTDAWEPGLTLVAVNVTIEPRDVQFTDRPLAAVSMHALSRRYERGRDRSDEAVIADLRALADPSLAVMPAGDFSVAMGAGWWAGRRVLIKGETELQTFARTYYDNDALPGDALIRGRQEAVPA